MPLLWDPAGRMIPPGKVERTLDAPMLDGALPSWLTTPSGTPTFGATASTRGYLQLTTGATSGNTAGVRTAATFNLADAKAIRWEAQGLTRDSDIAQIALGITSPTTAGIGAFCKQDSSDTTVFIAMAGNSAGVPYNIKTAGEYARRRNLAILLLPPTKEVYLLEDDQVMAYRQHTALNLGAVAGDLTITTREAVAHNFQVVRLRFTLWQD